LVSGPNSRSAWNEVEMKSFNESPGRNTPLLLGVLVLLALPVYSGVAPPSLVRIDLDRPLATLGVPVLAHFEDGMGREYVLSRVAVSDLEAAGIGYSMVDPDASDAQYLVALEHRPGGREAAFRSTQVLLDDGLRLVVRADTRRARSLAKLGFAIARLPARPVQLRTLTPTEYRVGFDPGVEAMVAEVDELTVWDYEGDLSGENPVTIRGSKHTLTTRHTASGEPIQKASRYVFEHLRALGLEVSYQRWSDGGFAGRNVIGEHPGLSAQDEVVLVTAHLDDMPDVGRAPGADDNASGCVGVMIAADILSQRSFERTIRFAFFTGEEQGLFGSAAYARRAAAAGENIVAVLNLDMIAWDEHEGPILRLHTRPSGNPGYPGDASIADAFTEVVSTYALGTELLPILTAAGVTASDHSPFWNEGYPAILAIEDNRDDFNPYYHSTNDRRQFLNLPYFTNFVKAVVGTAAHLTKLTGRSQVLRPNQLAGELLAPNQVRLTWNDRSDNESFFEIQTKTGPDAWQLATTAAADKQRARIAQLAPAVTYSFRVRAASLHGPSVWSKKLKLTTPELLPRPENLRATVRSSSRVVLRWEDRSEGEELFEVQMRTTRSPWRLASSVPADATRLVIRDLAPQTTYRFRVRARSAGALSHWSAMRVATTPTAD
jgi:hypothetical protein